MRAPAAAATAADHNDYDLQPVVRGRLYDLRLTTQRQFQERRDKFDHNERVEVVQAATSARQ